LVNEFADPDSARIFRAHAQKSEPRNSPGKGRPARLPGIFATRYARKTPPLSAHGRFLKHLLRT